MRRDDGSWEVYYKAPLGDINTTIECYAALRACGLPKDDPGMAKTLAWILSHGGLTRFPFQANLHGLPPMVVKECLLAFIQAWTARDAAPPARDFEEFILQKMGAGIARHFTAISAMLSEPTAL